MDPKALDISKPHKLFILSLGSLLRQHLLMGLTEGSSLKKRHNECLKEEVKKSCLHALFLTKKLTN